FPGAQIVSTSWTREKLRSDATESVVRDRAAAARELAGWRAGRVSVAPRDRALLDGWYRGLRATPPGLRVPPPNVAIAPEITISGTRRSVRVVTFGGGHSPSDVLAYVPEDRIAVMGDLLTVGYHPSLPDGDPDRWVEILNRVLRLGVDQAVPGHGTVGGSPDIRQVQRYIRRLQASTQRWRSAGLRALPDPLPPPRAPFDRWKFTDFYRENLEFVLRGGRSSVRS
ncbi:MAG: hypothetical protein L3J73_03490, partial [Thermoplasmata archaeon]|nr:hypothetical protein [Thermoplasmata archaeon]